jgi:hypothetical protein
MPRKERKDRKRKKVINSKAKGDEVGYRKRKREGVSDRASASSKESGVTNN